MCDLAAQVTSSLLPFPGVTTDALGEDEITLDSVLHGRFTVGRSGLAWLACGPHLEVVHAVTGERLSAYCFSSGGEHPPGVLVARDFSWLRRSGLLVGLEEAEGSMLCLYDLGLSRVVKAVVIPGRITAIEPLVSYGGASTSTQHLHQSLRWFFGIAAVVTDLGHVLLVDLCLDDLSCSQSELEASDLEVVTKSPAEIPRLREVSSRQGRHLCLQLNGPTGVRATALQYISRTNHLAVGFSDGYLQLWNMKALKAEYNSQLEGGRVPVYAFTFQEPENDPRNCCYLWAVQSAQDLEGDMVSLHLLQLAFSERKCLASGKILYEGLEYCEERYSQELSGPAFPHRAQATNTRLLSCQTIEKIRPHPDRDDSMNEAASPDTSVSFFSWQVKAYGQGTPCTYVGVFDINRWYHAQMPDSLRTGESLQSCPYLAVWSLDAVMQMVSPHTLLDVVVHERSLSRGLPFTCPPPEQYFNPTTYNFDATCLLHSGIVHLTCSGYQKETLSFLRKAAPCSSDIISTCYSRCLMSGLLSSRLANTQVSSLSQEEQLDAILSTAVETSSVGLITGCIKQWAAEEQPGSALNLRYILEWAWNKVVQTKEELDGICAPLFDSSSNFTDSQTMQLLQHSQRLLGNLSSIFHCLLSEAQELTQRGLVGLMNKNMVCSLISQYAQVVLWFCRTGLLPEGSDEDALQISRPFYSHSAVSNYYTIRREELTKLTKGKWCADCLMIDGLVGHCGERLASLWKRDEGGTGQYPPLTLHALLDIYLLDNIDEATKHAIVIYLLLDIMYSFPNKEGAAVESFPTAFAIPIGLVKLVQGLWLLDHRDHQSSLELLLHPAASQCQFEWQHERVLQALMCQGQHFGALRYFHITKPPISSTSQAKLCLSVLLHNRCLIEAWSLLRQHSNRLNMGELLSFLYESCQELGLIKELLKLPLGLTEQECLEKFLQGTGGLQNRELLMVHYLQQANYIPAVQLNQSLKMNLVGERDPKLKERSNTRNSILDQYGKVLPRVQMKLAMERAKPYQYPSTTHREVSRPQPLSTITKRSASEKVMSKSGFINNVLNKIEEVWLGKGATPQTSPARSLKAADFQSPSLKPSSLAQPDLEPFLGTPITMTSKRKSRLLDLVVHPSSQTPRPLLSPPRLPNSRVSPKSISKAPELSLLQTPQVVKRARALAASGPMFSAFTPQSILRSSLRPTPVATPSASPGRSITPPLRSKEKKGIQWSNGMAAEGEISLLSKTTHQTWSSQPGAEQEEDADEEDEQLHVKFLPLEDGIPSPQLRGSESNSSSTQEVAAETRSSGLEIPEKIQARPSLGLETSQASVHSTDTTLEFYDAPLSADREREDEHTTTEKDEEVVIVNIKAPAETEDAEMEGAEAEGAKMEDTETETIEKEGAEKEDAETEAAETEGPKMEAAETENAKMEDAETEGAEIEDAETEESVQKSLTSNEQIPLPILEYTENEGQEVKRDLLSFTFEEVTGIGLEQEAKMEEEEGVKSVKEEEELGIVESSRAEEDSSTNGHEEVSGHAHATHIQEIAENVDSSPDVELQDQPEKAVGQDDQSQATESSETIEHMEQSKPTEPPTEAADDMEQESGDLTEFVERHLFGSDMSPLTRSGIHNASHSQTSFSSEALAEVEEEEHKAPEGSPLFTSQKSTASVTSSEATGTDSHSVVSVNDSEELSSPASEEEEEEEESDHPEDEEEEEEGEEEVEEEEEEDSGSEVEIIEEVQGNGRLPPLQPSPLFIQEPQEHTHYLTSMSEDEAAALALITSNAEMKMVEEEMEGEVVMVRLGADEEGMEDEEQESSYMELKPSTTLVVPLELVEGQHGLVDGIQLDLPELGQTSESHDAETGAQSNFSLMLELEEDGLKEEGTVPMENDMQSSTPPTQPPVTEVNVEVASKPEVILLGSDDQDILMSGNASYEDQEKEVETKDGTEVDGLTEADSAKHQNGQPIEYIGTDEKLEDCKEQKEAESSMLNEDQSGHGEEPDSLLVSGSTPVPEVSAVSDSEEQSNKDDMAFEDAVENEMEEDKDKAAPSEDHKEPEKNGPVEADAEMVHSAETALAVVQTHQQDCGPVTASPQDIKETEEENEDEIKKQEEKKMRTNEKEREDETAEEEEQVEQVLNSNSQPEPQLASETTTSQRKKKAPSTPTRRSTREKRTVSFIFPVTEEKEVTEEAEMAEETETSSQVPASPSRTRRRSKQVKETKILTSTPRRSARIAQPEPSKDDVEDSENGEQTEAMNNDTSVAVTSSSSTPGKRRISQKATPTRTSQRSQCSSKEVPTATEIIMKEDEKEEEAEAKNTNNDVPTTAKCRATQENTPRRASRRVPTTAKCRATQENTPRRASRRVLRSSEALETLKEENEEEDVLAPSVKRNSRRPKKELLEVQPALLEEDMDEEDVKKQQLSSPVTVTHRFSHMTLNIYPQSTRKMRGANAENVKENKELLESTVKSSACRTKSRQTTRSKLWDHPEDLPLLDSPLEVDSETPVADALIKRLQDQEEKQDGGVTVSKMVRTSKRRVKSSVEQPPSLPAVGVKDGVVPENDEPIPSEPSFIYSPSRRGTRALSAEFPIESEVSLPPVTRRKRKGVKHAHKELASEDDNVELENAEVISKTRKTGNRTAKSKAVLEPPPIVEVNLISPLPSPADPVPKAQKRIKEGDIQPSSMNLRRKRIMDTVFTKPVTRRKKL
ncbi:hypothetical protein LDENG_00132010 [Lucifuga dentata]|nr:hypothetical protein LDENG_00132010 [Lucifuga dentata]